ncbi:GGDEF domain-containing protein [Nakamurella silvestris]|nr:GGDEF domain-containing protein [Nakamurella silvestris]
MPHRMFQSAYARYHLIGAVGVTSLAVIMAAASLAAGSEHVNRMPPLLLVWCGIGWGYFALARRHRSPAWWLVWPVLYILQVATFDWFDPYTGPLVIGLFYIAFVYAGLTQPPGRSLWLLPAALGSLWLIIDISWERAAVRVAIAAVTYSVAAELPARLLRSLKGAQDRLAAAVATDPLTGAQNRRLLTNHLGTHEGSAYLVMVDLDHFKGYNDTRGHVAGDELLVDFAQMLRDNSRADDIIVRFGGEEFLVILPAMDRQGTEATVRRWQTIWSGHHSGLTFSAGIARHDGIEAVANADRGLYAAKAAGRDRAVTVD